MAKITLPVTVWLLGTSPLPSPRRSATNAKRSATSLGERQQSRRFSSAHGSIGTAPRKQRNSRPPSREFPLSRSYIASIRASPSTFTFCSPLYSFALRGEEEGDDSGMKVFALADVEAACSCVCAELRMFVAGHAEDRSRRPL